VPKSRSKEESVPSATLGSVVDHLWLAFDSVAENKGAPGPDGQTIEEVRKHFPAIEAQLRATLLNGTYRPGDIRRVWIPKSGGGQRGLGIPDVVDRVVSEAVRLVLEPVYEPTFHVQSHGFRPDRSCHTAIAQAQEHLEEGFEWVVDLDLEKFFDRVHHQRLMARLSERVHDRDLLALIGRMLKAKVVLPDGVKVSTDEGVPQGGPLSPLLSNIVLDELDEELVRRGHRFVRYADDCNIYVRSEQAGHRVMASIVSFIERRLRLKVNVGKSAVARPEERHFLGFRLRRDPLEGDVDVLLSERSKERLDSRIHELTPRNWGNSVAECIRQVNVYLEGWLGFFWVATRIASNLTHADAHLRRRLRAIQLKHWKRRSTMVCKLIALGVKPSAARQGIYGDHRSLWALSHTPVVDRGLSTSYWARKGLVSLTKEWRIKRQTEVASGVQLRLPWG
jgi:group II intron reverse transcriptase/maturase